MLLAAVTRVFEPGHKYDYAVILEGIEGKGNSTFIKTLAMDWFGELTGNFHDRKSMVEQMQGCWILELPELSSMQKSETTDVKQFMSAESDKVRLSYARRAENFRRQCIFIGSTNDSRYLQSETGNRRFHPVLCAVDEIDMETFRKEVDQYWAEAYSTYLDMRDEQPEGDLPLYLTGEAAQEEALAQQASRKTASTAEIYAGQIQEYLDTPTTIRSINEDPSASFENEEPNYLRTRTCISQLHDHLAGGRPEQRMTPEIVKDIALALDKIEGWVPIPNTSGRLRFLKYGQQRAFVRQGASPTDITRGYIEIENA